jgi:hypothetical protein
MQQVDKGFRTWFARLIITHLRREEHMVVEQRRARIEAEWQWFFAIRHMAYFGWAMVRMFLWTVWYFMAGAGFVMAVIMWAGSLMFLALLSCPWVPPDTCPAIELRYGRSNKIIFTEEDMSIVLLTIEALRASTAEILEITVLHWSKNQQSWNAYEARVCHRLSMAGLWAPDGSGLNLAGVYKI